MVTGWPVAWRNLKHELNHSCHFLGEVLGDSGVFTFDHFLVEALHVVSSERGYKSTHFVQDTTQRPNVTFRVIGHVSPNLGACIIGRTGLGITQSLLYDFGNIKISKFGLHIPIQEDVGTFHVSVQDFALVKYLEASDDLDEDVPDLLLFDVGFSLLVVTDLLKYVSVICILHHQAIVIGCQNRLLLLTKANCSSHR